LNQKIIIHRCSRCNRTIWVPESIIRGMGPICFGKSYTNKVLLKRGLTQDEINNIPKDKMKKLVNEAVRRYKRKQKRNQKIRISRSKIRNFKKDDKQKTLDSFISIEVQHEENEIEALRTEMNEITQKIAKTSGSKQMMLSDRVFEIIEIIKKLEKCSK